MSCGVFAMYMAPFSADSGLSPPETSPRSTLSGCAPDQELEGHTPVGHADVNLVGPDPGAEYLSNTRLQPVTGSPRPLQQPRLPTLVMGLRNT